MIYYETPGVLMDVVYFFVFFYNEEYIFKRRKIQYNEEEEHHLRYYYEVKEIFNSLPYELHPIAYSDDKRPSIISKMLTEQPFQTVTLNKILDYFVSEDFKKRIYQYWFNTTSETDLKNFDYIKAIPQLSVSELMKYRLIIFLNHYERYIKEFVNLFIQVYDNIIELRERQKKIIEQIKVVANQEDCYKKILSTYNWDVSDFNYSIVIINTILLYYGDKNRSIFFGIEGRDLFGTERNCNMESFAYVYSDTTRVNIVEIVAKHQPICATDIDEKLETKHTTIYHHLNILVEEGILILKKSNTDQKFYYRINVDYFENMYHVSQDALQLYQKSNVKLESE